MKTPQQLAVKLRNGESLAHCDSLLSYADGVFSESHMTYDGYGHYFAETRLSWKQALRLIKSGAYY